MWTWSAPRYPDKEFYTTPMTRESERCRMALELAERGKETALVCSGDSGVYGLAALVYELRGERSAPEIAVVPGLTAACSGAAVLGAPLTTILPVISLSDRLTPWPAIEARLEAAAAGDLSIVLYNPASHGRPSICAAPAGSCCAACRRSGPAAWPAASAGTGKAAWC